MQGPVDKATAQVAALFGAAMPDSFSTSGESVSSTGPIGESSPCSHVTRIRKKPEIIFVAH